jgi:hypothetical protein
MNSAFTKRTAPFLAAGALLLTPAVAGAATVNPVWYDDNPTCADFGYGHEIKFDPPSSGSKTVDGVTVDLTVGADQAVSWTSSAPIDAVIVKGGSEGNLYTYPGESSGDAGLHTPVNPNNGTFFGLSHVNFCWDDAHPDTPGTPDTPDTPQTPPPADQQPPVVVIPPQDDQGGVKGAEAQSGSSRLTGTSGCAGKTVKATVKGAEIAKVVFRLDGKKVKTLRRGGTYTVKSSKLAPGVHRIKAKVTYTAASGTKSSTHVLTFQRCVAKKIAPRFAG